MDHRLDTQRLLTIGLKVCKHLIETYFHCLENVDFFYNYNSSIGRQVEYPFVGPLKDLTKIDAVFRLYNSESKDQIVIVGGFRYCIITQHNTNISDDMNGVRINQFT